MCIFFYLQNKNRYWVSKVGLVRFGFFFFQMNRPGKYVKSYGYIQKFYNNEPWPLSPVKKGRTWAEDTNSASSPDIWNQQHKWPTKSSRLTEIFFMWIQVMIYKVVNKNPFIYFLRGNNNWMCVIIAQRQEKSRNLTAGCSLHTSCSGASLLWPLKLRLGPTHPKQMPSPSEHLD